MRLMKCGKPERRWWRTVRQRTQELHLSRVVLVDAAALHAPGQVLLQLPFLFGRQFGAIREPLSKSLVLIHGSAQ